jgi:hypothetical protein
LKLRATGASDTEKVPQFFGRQLGQAKYFDGGFEAIRIVRPAQLIGQGVERFGDEGS